MKRVRSDFPAVLLIAVMLFVMSAPVFAQTSRGTVTGTVTDPQGAIIQGATAELKNTLTNQTRTATTNDAGIYRFDAVDLGVYDVKISAQGFKSFTAKGIEIQANRIATFDARLETGGTDVVVEVNAGTEEILQKSDAVRGGNFNAREISRLSLPNLNPYEIARIGLPGVVLPTGSSTFGNSGSSQFAINGQRPRGNNYLIDGTENNDISVTGPAVTLNNQDAVAELSAQTSNFSAEFGRAGGGVFNQVTKSGTNQFHGTARELYLSQNFNATTNGQRLSGLHAPPVFTENIFGGTLGGPIKKDKTFFFGAAQWDRFRAASNFPGFVVPTANGLARLRQLFPAGTNPRVDLYLKAFQGLVGISNPTQVALGKDASGVDRGSIEFGGVGISAGEISNARQFVARVDHTISEAHRLSFRYILSDSIDTPSNISNPGFIQDFNGRSQNFLVTHTWVINPTMTNEFRSSFGRIGFNFPISPKSLPEAFTLPKVNIQGITGFGIETNIPQFRFANNYLVQETMSKVYKSHTFRFGGEYLRQIARQHPPFVERGSFAFLSSGGFSGLANYIDNFSGFRATANKNFGDPVYNPNLDRISLFFQDTWKATRKLSLTFGLRYENFGQPANNAFGFPAINLDPATFLTPNKVARDNNNFGPVVGFAWSPRFKSGVLGRLFGEDKTVWRGGYQVSYDTFFNNLLSNIAADSPNSLSTTFTDASTGSAATSRGTANFFPGTLPSVARVPVPTDSQTSLFNPNIRNPYTQRFSFGMQRQLPWKVLMDVSYVGSLGRKLFLSEDLNPFVSPGVRRFPNLGIRRMRSSGANSNYNSLQVRLDKAFGHGVQIVSSYTWSKFIDSVSEVFDTNAGGRFASVPVFQGGLKLDRGNSDYDRRHVFTTGYIWEIPGPKHGFLSQVAGGWQLAGAAIFQSGAPYTLLNGADRNGDGVPVGNSLDRPDIGNPSAPHNTRAIISTTCSTGYANPDAASACVTRNDVFLVQGTGLPNAATIGRNTEHSKSVQTFSTTVFKTFTLTERFKLEYRLETFNTFNHPQFTGIPGNSVVGSLPNRYQRFDLLNGGGRTARMGLKLIF